MLSDSDMALIESHWSRGLAKASFGAGQGECAMTGGRDGSVVLYLCRDDAQLESEHKAGVPYLFSVGGYKRLKALLDAKFPPPPPRPPRPKPTGSLVVTPLAKPLTPSQPQS
jgi:hypothetical protein